MFVFESPGSTDPLIIVKVAQHHGVSKEEVRLSGAIMKHKRTRTQQGMPVTQGGVFQPAVNLLPAAKLFLGMILCTLGYLYPALILKLKQPSSLAD